MDLSNRSNVARNDEVVLFDLPTKEPRECSSQNVWKVRALLNFKNIPYRTNWIEYPDLHETFKGLGIPKNDKSKGAYTEYWCPLIRFPDGKYVMESYEIAESLEELWPEPKLYVTSPTTKHTQDIVDSITYALGPGHMYRLAEHFTPESRAWYHHHRGRLFGLENCHQIAELEPFSGEAQWQTADSGLRNLLLLLSENDTGPFVLGNTTSYADFIIGGLYVFLKLVDRNGDVFGRLTKMNPIFARHEEALRPWFTRKTY